MPSEPPEWLRAVVSELSARGHVTSANLEYPNSGTSQAGSAGSGKLSIETGDGRRFALAIDAKRGRIGTAAAARWIDTTGPAGSNPDRTGTGNAGGGANANDQAPVLAAPAIGQHVATQLRAARRSFVDGRGLVFLWLDGGRHVIDVTMGLAGPRPSMGTAVSPGGLRVLFALLANPENLARTVREVGERARTSRHTVSTTLAALRSEGLALRTGRSTHAWAPGRAAELVDRFADGWRTQLRPRVLQARLSGHGPEVDEPALEALLTGSDLRFGFGSSAGAYRLTPFYRDAETVVHLDGAWRPEWNRILRVAPQPERGAILVLAALGAEDFVLGQQAVHPLLLYAELDGSRDPRNREFASELLPAVLAEIEDDR